MYGWRARLGLIVPRDNAVTEPEFAALAPPGVACYATRLQTYGRPAMLREAVERSLVYSGGPGISAIGYACAETGSVDGQDSNDWLMAGIEQTTSVPALTATAAVLEALAALDARSVVIAAPYPTDRAEAMAAFLERRGHQVAAVESLDLTEGPDRPEAWRDVNDMPPARMYRLAHRLRETSSDAVVMPATNVQMSPVVEHLERDLGRPVVTGNAALLWGLLRLAGVSSDRSDSPRAPGRGR